MVFLKDNSETYLKKQQLHKVLLVKCLLQLCESRLDNVVYRMGLSRSTKRCKTTCFSQTHYSKWQVLLTFHHTVLKAGDVVAVREKSKSLEAINASLESSSAVFMSGLHLITIQNLELLYLYQQEFKFQKTSMSNSSLNCTLNN